MRALCPSPLHPHNPHRAPLLHCRLLWRRARRSQPSSLTCAPTSARSPARCDGAGVLRGGGGVGRAGHAHRDEGMIGAGRGAGRRCHLLHRLHLPARYPCPTAARRGHTGRLVHDTPRGTCPRPTGTLRLPPRLPCHAHHHTPTPLALCAALPASGALHSPSSSP